MPANKKKKKPAANPARGFATTSVASKPKLAESESKTLPESAGTDTPGIDEPAAALQSPNGIRNDYAEDSISSMTPGQLELHLEDAELQSLIEQHGPRCRADSQRQVARLRSEKRQLRPQSHSLYTEDWLDDNLVETTLQSFEAEQSALRVQQPNNAGERLLLDLWILHRVLSALDLPRADDAISHVLQTTTHSPTRPVNSMPYGFSEALDWYASQLRVSALPKYDEMPMQQPQGSSTTWPELEYQPKRIVVKAEGADTEVDSHLDSVSSSEDDIDDDDPARLVDRWVQLQRRLWKRLNPRSLDRRANPNRVKKLQSRISALERDVLFERDNAEPIWAAMQIELQRERAMRRREADVSPAIAMSRLAEHEDKLAQSIAPSVDADADDILGNMFGGEQSGDAVTESTVNIHIKDFGKYSGLSPRKLLDQVCNTIDARVTIKVVAKHQTSYSARHSLECWWSKPQPLGPFLIEALPNGISHSIKETHWKLEMYEVAASTPASSVDYISALTLFLALNLPGQDVKSAKRLPAVWAQLLVDLGEEQKRLSEADEKATLRNLRNIISNAYNDSQSETTSTSTSRGVSRHPVLHARKDLGRLTTSVMDPEQASAAWSGRSSRTSFQDMLRFRNQLPIARHKGTILQTIAEHPLVVICAETGSGKSTQAGSYLLEANLSAGRDCRILVTQPRRISAISLARRVSLEIGEARSDLGTLRSLVGYAIRLESKTSEATRLTFATTGVLLRMLESSPTLDQLDYLILDEVHERTMEMDLAFIALRRLQQLRPSLKIVLMSATVNAKKFSDYFGGAPILDIEGRTYPVTVKYLEDAVEATNDIVSVGAIIPETEENQDTDDSSHESSKKNDSLKGYSKSTLQRLAGVDEYRVDYELIVKLATAIATKSEFSKYSKAILIFMPGIAEIRRLHSALLSTPTFSQKWEVHMLHSSFSTEELERAFAVPYGGYRKIVIATNIAETGITIPDVTAVIDTCKEKIMRFDERRQLSRLTEGFIARSSAKQRRGRAARVQDGLCFHLVTKSRHDELFLEAQVPEMLRLSLQDSIMRIKLWEAGASIEDTLAAAIDPPSRKNVNRAIERLKEAGALNSSEYLTPLGERIARLPLDVSMAKLAVLGTIFGCLDPIVTIIALMTSKSIFSSTGTAKASFARGSSDLLSSLAAYEAWRKAKTAGLGFDFARKHRLLNLNEIEDVKVQLTVYLADGGLLKLSSDEKTLLNNSRIHSSRCGFYVLPERYNQTASDPLLLSLIATSFYPRCLIREGKGYRNIFSNQQVTPARGSVIRDMQKPPKWLSFSEAMQTRAANLINVQEASQIPDQALSLMLGSDADISIFSGVILIDGRIRLSVRTWKQALAIKLLRKKLKNALERRYRDPDGSDTETDQFIDVLRRMGESHTSGVPR